MYSYMRLKSEIQQLSQFSELAYESIRAKLDNDYEKDKDYEE